MAMLAVPGTAMGMTMGTVGLGAHGGQRPGSLPRAAACASAQPEGANGLLRSRGEQDCDHLRPDSRSKVRGRRQATHVSAPPACCSTSRPDRAAARAHSTELQHSPKSRAALSLLGHCYYHLQDFPAAATTCARTLTRWH
jgi:hypothetical protein